MTYRSYNMDITPSIVNRVLLPLAIFEDDFEHLSTTACPESETRSRSSRSLLAATWIIDGGEPHSFRFFAVPHFARGRPPLQLFVIVPLDQMAVHPSLVQSLQLDRVFSSTKAELPTLPLARHLLQALSSWSSERPDFEEMYLSMPFGSRIIVETIHEDVRQMRIHLSPIYNLEQEWLSVPMFEAQTGLNLSSLVDLVDWTELELERQLHDSISLVRIPTKAGSKLMVYKAVTEDVHYMYHELRTLLSMRSHTIIIKRPRYIVVKQCRFGGKVGICGFILEYYPYGSLQNTLQAGQPIVLRQKLYWSQQLTLALIHVRDKGPGFYSDLKPNNILLNQTLGDDLTAPLLIDFEQRGSWFNWSPPEVQYVEYLDMLATSTSSSRIRTRYRAILRKCVPGWTSNYKRRPLIAAPEGYSLGWTILGPTERQRAQIFCLGKILWCIFEELPSCNTFLTIETFAEGINQKQCFPEFQNTPMELRELISRCTADAPEWENHVFPVVHKGDKLIPKSLADSSGRELDANEIQHLAREWWRERLEVAEDFVQRRYSGGPDISMSEGFITANDKALQTPTLEEIRDILTSLLTNTDLLLNTYPIR
jgi:serine/threonine protein kinase